MEKICDNKSVGVVIANAEGEFLLLDRAKFPFGLAAPAGHVDDHGSVEQTAIEEVYEEVGLRIGVESLIKVIDARRVENACRRLGGDYHEWTVFSARASTNDITPSADETKGARWYSRGELQTIAADTRDAFRGGHMAGKPVFEKIWLDFFSELGIVE